MTTNREHVGKALVLARDGLRPFVERCFKRSPGGLDQVQVVLQGTDYDDIADPLADIAALVRLMLTSRVWVDVIQPNLKRTVRGQVRNFVGEVGSARNRWAHQDTFSDDDTERALDTIHRLLRDINANQAEQAARALADYRADRLAPAPPPAPPAAVEPTPPPEAAPETPPEPLADTPNEFEQAAVREIENLRSQITAKRAEREGLDVRRNYLEEDQVRVAREFQENQRRIGNEIAAVDAERKDADEEIARLEHRLGLVSATVAPPLLAPPSEGQAPPPSSGTPAVPAGVEGSASDPPASVPHPGTGPRSPQTATSKASADLVCELLAEVGKPLHFREIYKRVASHDPNPPRSRKGDHASAYLARYFRDPRLQRTGRGTYALSATPNAPVPPPPPPRPRSQAAHRNPKPAAFVLWGERREVRSFGQVFLAVCATMWERFPQRFERVLELHGRSRPYFSRNPADLRRPEQVANSGIFVEMNEGSDRLIQRCRQVLQICGVDPAEFSVEVR